MNGLNVEKGAGGVRTDGGRVVGRDGMGWDGMGSVVAHLTAHRQSTLSVCIPAYRHTILHNMTTVICPSTIPPSIVTLLEAFYKASDAVPSSSSLSDSTHQAYTDFFVDRPTFLMGPTTANDKNGIREWRQGGWKGITSRRHVVENVYPAGQLRDDDDQAELMLYGTVDYGVSDGGNGRAEWAGRMVLKKQDKEWRISYYQVYITRR